MSMYQGIPDRLSKGRRPIDPTRIVAKVGGGFNEAIRDDAHVYVQHIQYNLATDLVNDFNRGHYPDVCRWMERNQRKLTGYGICLWMGMVDHINAAVNPTFQNNANPNGGKPVPKGYQGTNLDPYQTGGRVIKRNSAHPCQMWKTTLKNPNVTGAKNILWTDQEQLAEDLAYLVNTRDFQATWDFMDWIKHNVPQVGFGQAGTHLLPAYYTFMDILEHEISNCKARKASASLFAAPPVGRIPDDEEAADENYALDTGDTFGIGQPNRKSTKEWEPDTPDPDVDLMKSIRDACTR